MLKSSEILSFHDACLSTPNWAKAVDAKFNDGVWQAIEQNHRCNNLLWDEEDLARRKNVADALIVANKRAIDGYNQRRNDAIERIDEYILHSLKYVLPKAGARLNSETLGSITDRLSIVSLKIRAMREQTTREDVDPQHIENCRAKLSRLEEQRADLAGCFDSVLEECRTGSAYYKVYRQFKMYNDETLNPALYGRRP